MSQDRPRPALIFIWLVLAGLAAAIGYMKYSDWKQSGAEQTERALRDEKSLLPVPIEDINVVEIGHAGTLHRFERDAAGAWFYHAHGVSTGVLASHGHVADPDQAARIGKAFAGLDRARIERRLESDGNEQYGVTTPQMLLLVYGANVTGKPLAQYAVGDVAPDKFSRYVMLVDTSQVVTIADYQITNLLDLIKQMSSVSAAGTATPPGKPGASPS